MVNVQGIKFKNPVVLASGPFGNGKEISQRLNLNLVGGFTSKTVTVEPKDGNPPPRIVNLDNGLLNSIGLQNPGIDIFVNKDMAFLKTIPTNLIVSIGGYKLNDFVSVVKRLDFDEIKIFELNLSCPNVENGGATLGEHPASVKRITAAVKKNTSKPVFVKLGAHPNIVDLVKAAVDGGADGITLINSLKGAKIDIHTGKPILKRVVGGLSGPIIKPVAIGTVYRIREAFLDLPIIGMGGVITTEDAVEFIMAGANLIGIGYAGLLDPTIPAKIANGIENFLLNKGIKLEELTSIAHRGGMDVLR